MLSSYYRVSISSAASAQIDRSNNVTRLHDEPELRFHAGSNTEVFALAQTFSSAAPLESKSHPMDPTSRHPGGKFLRTLMNHSAISLQSLNIITPVASEH